MATRSSWPFRRTQSTRRSTITSLSISSATLPGGEHCQYPPRHGSESVGSGEDGSRVHRLCQGQSWQAPHSVRRPRDHDGSDSGSRDAHRRAPVVLCFFSQSSIFRHTAAIASSRVPLNLISVAFAFLG